MIGCEVFQPIREEEIKTLLFSDWFTDLTTNHKVLVFRKRDLMFRTEHGIELGAWNSPGGYAFNWECHLSTALIEFVAVIQARKGSIWCWAGEGQSSVVE